MKHMVTKESIYRGEKIGIIGLGTMGGHIAENFMKKKYQLFVCDLNEIAVKKFAKEGAIACANPKEVAQNADFIFDITPNDLSSKKVWTGKNGILEGATPDKILIVSATLSAGWIDTLAKKCKEGGFHFFDICINGGDRGISFLCGGDKVLLKEITPVLRGAAAKIIYIGPVGQGTRYKLILNFLQAVHIIGFRQAMRIAKYQNMNLKKVGNALSKRPGGPLTEAAWEAYQEGSDETYFKIELITKDLTYAKTLAEHVDASLLVPALAEYKKALESGHAKEDWLSIVTLDD
jgi:3-hydroxyisobutyrate dehydrogenase-like beta-hydroxyacid dehydrogenase